MITLETKIEELEAKGLSKKEVYLQTQDLFQQLIDEPLDEEKDYMVDLKATLHLKSRFKPEKLQSLLDEPRIKELILQLAGEEELETEILHVETESVIEFDHL